jgi:hypothetical protein
MKSLYAFSLLLLSITIHGKENSSSDMFLLIGEPYDVEFVKFNSDENSIKPSTWKLKIKNVKVIEGKEVSFPKKISVYLKARNGNVLEKYNQIFLKVRGNSKSPELLHWFKPVQMICLPENLMDDDKRDIYFDMPFGGNTDKCRLYNSPLE